MKLIKTKGIIIYSNSIFEKDRIITFFTYHQGKLKAIAKGANTKKFKFGGRIDVGNLVYIELSKGKNFYYINQCDILESFNDIRKNFNKIILMSYFFDIIRKATTFDQINQDLFNLLKTTLKILNKNNNLNNLIIDFQSSFLKIEGLMEKNTSYKVKFSIFQKIFEEYTGKIILKPKFI